MTRLTYNIVLVAIFAGISMFAIYKVYHPVQRKDSVFIKTFRTREAIQSLLTAMDAEAAFREEKPPGSMREALDWIGQGEKAYMWFDLIRGRGVLNLDDGILFDAWGTPIQLVQYTESNNPSQGPDIYVLVSYGPNRQNDAGLPDDIVGTLKFASQTSSSEDSEFPTVEAGSELSKIIRAIGEK